MTAEQFREYKQEMKEHTTEVIKVTVNGKIDSIAKKLDAYIVADKQWKEDAAPVIKLGKNMTGFGAVSAYLLGTLAAFGASWGVIEWIAGKITHK